MTIDEAIRLQGLLYESSILDPLPRYKESVKLSVEALDCIRILRIIPDKRLNLVLPSETKA